MGVGDGGGGGTARKLNENRGRTPAPLPYPCIVTEHIITVTGDNMYIDVYGTYCRNSCVYLSPIIRIPKLSSLSVSVCLSLSRLV